MTTDEGGVAVIHLDRQRARRNAVTIEASDKEGNRASSSLQLQTRQGADQILLRTERAVYRAGDRIQLARLFDQDARHRLCGRGEGRANRADARPGHRERPGRLALTATPDLAGTLDFNAYLFGSDARPVGDHRLVFVQPADELKIEATADAASYKPGDDARVRFRVTNSRGEGVQAALGLQVVDEAVFALAEKQPGFAKVSSTWSRKP